MKQILIRFLSALLCLALLGPAAAFAEGEAAPSVNTDALNGMMYDYISANNLNPDNISIGYYYSGTGERYYFNENKWYYSASMYKVPLMMILAERERSGELTLDSVINGLTLKYAEESILVYSNNDFAHLMMNYIGTDRQCRELYQQYSDLPVEDYDPDFYDYSYFTARFMTDVMVTLFNDPDRFPHIIDRLKEAQPGEYFRRYLGDQYEIAQKYGSYTDWSARDFNHTSGIIYTEHPFVLTVMTLNTPNHMGVIGDLAGMFAEYTEGLDAQMDQWEARQQAEAEAARLAAEEEERAAQQAAQPSPEPAPVLETPVPAATPEPAPTAAPTPESPEKQSTGLSLPLLLAIAAVAVLILGLVAAWVGARRRKRRRLRRQREAALRRARQEARQVRQERETGQRPSPRPERESTRQERRYTPRH